MICPGCKKEIEDDSNFCSFCGFQIVKDTTLNEETSNPNPFVDIYTPQGPVELSFVSTFLEDNGIEVHVGNYYLSNLGVLGEAGRIRISVKKEDEQKANELIEEYEKEKEKA